MKKLNSILCLTLFLFLATNAAFANSTANSTPNSSSIEEAEIYGSFAEIDDLVAYVSENENASFSELLASNSPLLENVNAESAVAMNSQETLHPPIFNAFIWGCCYGPVGMILVAVCTNNDREQVRQAANGCILFHVGMAILYGLSFVLYYSGY